MGAEFVFREPMNGQVFVDLPTGKDGKHIVGFFATAKKLRDLETSFRVMAEWLETNAPPKVPEEWVANAAPRRPSARWMVTEDDGRTYMHHVQGHVYIVARVEPDGGWAIHAEHDKACVDVALHEWTGADSIEAGQLAAEDALERILTEALSDLRSDR